MAVIGLLAFSYVMIGLKYVAGVGLTIVKDSRPMGLAVTLSGLVFIGLSVLLIPRFGLAGAALATLISQGLIPLYIFWRGQQVYRIPYRFGMAIALLIIAGALCIVGTVGLAAQGWLGIAERAGLVLLFALGGFALLLEKKPALAELR